MLVTSLTIAQLADFVESEQYKKLDIKPITPERAISQSKNPSALPDDVALVFIQENDQLLGFIGLLPVEAHGERFFSNTCWWGKPVQGQNVSMPLFYAALKASGNRFVVVDGTSHTKKILEATNFFDFVDNALGFRGFSRFYLHDLFLKKCPKAKVISFFFSVFDFVGNAVWASFSKIGFRANFNFEEVTTDDPRLKSLIRIKSNQLFFGRQESDFKWILSNPWLIDSCENQLNYPFSHFVKDFRLQFMLIKENENLIGAMLVSIRDGHLRIPYFFEGENVNSLDKIVLAVEQFVRFGKYKSVTVFNRSLSCGLEKAKHLFFLRKEIERVTCFSKEMKSYCQLHPTFQDGDGDAVFTG